MNSWRAWIGSSSRAARNRRRVLGRELEGKVAELYVIGDAKQPRDALDAIAEGAEVARAF